MVNSVIYQIKQAIIDNDPDQLIELADSHPDVDLENISPNGCSVLWWALAGVTPVNIAMIDVILNLKKTKDGSIPRVNPLQTFMKMSALDFARTMVVCAKDENKTLVQTLKDHVQKYESLKSSQATSAEEVKLTELLGEENTHNENIEAEVINSIIRLYRRYWSPQRPDTKKVILEAVKEIMNFLKQEPGLGLDSTVSALTKEQKVSALAAIKHIMTFSAFKYEPTETESVYISVLETLALVWRASLETNKYLVQDNAKSSDIRERRIQIIKHLAQFQNERGPNSPACANGARAQIVAALIGIHNDVQLFSSGKLDKIAIEYKLNAITRDFIEQYTIAKFNFYQQWLMESLFADVNSPDGLDNFKSTHKVNIIKLLHDSLQYEHRTKEEQELIGQVLNESFEYGPSITLHPLAKILQQIMSFCSNEPKDTLEEKISGIKSISEISRVSDELLGVKIDELVDRIGMRDVYSKLEWNDFNKLKFKKEFIARIKQLIIKSSTESFSLNSLLLSADSNNELMRETKYALISVFCDVVIRDKYIAEKNKKWFDSLSGQQREHLLQQVLGQQISSANITKNLGREIILNAVKLDFTRYLNLTGFNFAGVDCRGFALEGCDLTDADFTKAENIRLVSFDIDTIFKNTKFPEGIADFSDVCFANHNTEDLKKFVKLVLDTHRGQDAHNTLGYAIINNPHVIPAFLRLINRLSQQDRIEILSTICAQNLQVTLNLWGDHYQDVIIDRDPANWVRLSYNPLMLAIKYQPSVVNDILAAGKLLPLKNNATIHTAVNHNGDHSLLLAIRHNPTLVAALLEAIKDLPTNTQFLILSQQNNKKMNPLMLALKLADRNSATLLARFINEKRFTRKQRAMILKQVDLFGDNFLTLAARCGRAVLDDVLKLLHGLKDTDRKKYLLNEQGKNFLKELYATNPELAGEISYVLIKEFNGISLTVVNEIITHKFKLSNKSLKSMNCELLVNTIIYLMFMLLMTAVLFILCIDAIVGMPSTLFFLSLPVDFQPIVIATVILLSFTSGCASATLVASSAYSLCRLYNYQIQLAKDDKPTKDLAAVELAQEPEQPITPPLVAA